MAGVELKNVTKYYGNKQILKDINLSIKEGEFLAMVGSSGCGKTTILRMIAGLTDITSGSIFIKGVKVNDLQPKDRNVAMVFQHYALFPHINVFDNIAFGLRLRKFKKSEIENKVLRVAEALSVKDLLWSKPNKLSGGQKQRVALGRAIVIEPDLFLMDEPLSSLDADLRFQLREEIKDIHKKLGITVIYVTHDKNEAIFLADKVAVIGEGNILQIGIPEEIYS